ncbi:MAG: glycosyltransferase family 4 protein [Nitrospirota bacterium]
MKIAFIRKKYSPYGGAERYVNELARRLSMEGDQVFILANDWISDTETRMSFKKIPMIKGISFLETLSFALSAYIICRRMKFDIIQSNEKTLYQDIYRAGDGCHKEWLIQRLKVSPFLKRISVYLNPFHWLVLWIESRIFRQGHYKKIIANSKRGREEIIRHYNLPEEDISIVYNGVDIERFNPDNMGKYRDSIRKELSIGNEDIILLFIGSGFERKGLRYLIEALSVIKRGDVGLLIIGKGNTGYYHRLAERLGIQKRIYILGKQPDTERYYAASDIFILPTLYDPFPNVCLEALASGLPVITSKISGASEIISKGIDGMIIDNPDDPDEIAQKISMIIDIEKRTGLRIAARKKAEQFTYKENIRQSLEIYKEIIKR